MIEEAETPEEVIEDAEPPTSPDDPAPADGDLFDGDPPVYVLGGPSAISNDIEAALTADGDVATRLAGPSRVETAVAVAEEVSLLYGNGGGVLLARAYGTGAYDTSGWADAISGGIAAR